MGIIILGLNAFHGDSSACIIVDGKLLAAVEEERFTRIKHWAGFPKESIRYCLNKAGITIEDVDYIAVNRDPTANLMKKALFAFSKRPSLKMVTDRLKNATKVRNILEIIRGEFGADNNKIRAQVHNVEHHIAHLASSFFVSPFDEAAVVSIDGFGDFVGTMWGVASSNNIEVKQRICFPHSLGLFYLAFTQYLGFLNYGDEYKVMGLAAYGNPEFIDELRQIVKSTKDGEFRLDLDYFIHHSEGVTMSWDYGEPKMGPVFSQKLEDLLGPAREKGSEIDDRHKNIAASLQKRYEEVFFQILNHVYRKTKIPNLALAGGCAMNSLANGKIFENTPFQELYIQPAAGDAGGSIGAAYYVWNRILGKKRSFVLERPYLGPEYKIDDFNEVIKSHQLKIDEALCNVKKYDDQSELCHEAAKYISEGKVVGWFQGRMEWGARALGNRSILCDPRRPDMKDIMNLKIKRRESFRPFAPSILLERVGEYFEEDYPVPFMNKVYSIRPEKRYEIPAVTHVDGTGRLQTVSRKDNPLYCKLIKEFENITDVPIVLNTSFNENEPIVCNPEEALDCFLRTKMDILVLGKFIIRRTCSEPVLHRTNRQSRKICGNVKACPQ
jgi:carbamoyltransferase